MSALSIFPRSERAKQGAFESAFCPLTNRTSDPLQLLNRLMHIPWPHRTDGHALDLTSLK
jgi:hypothetical protein